jgi:chemotaxis protein methyltransferase CheR
MVTPQIVAKPTLARADALDADDLAFVAGAIKAASGVVLGERKRAMVQSRLSRRARELGLAGVGDYVRRLRADAALAEAERPSLIGALTTHHTGFFREAHHFEVLEREILPALLARRPRRLRFWSAACASGEEAYSLAAVLVAALARQPCPDARILATDIDEAMLAVARDGVYAAAALGRSGAARALMAESCGVPGRLRIGAALRACVSFRPLNLNGPWPFSGPFDVILCRNVMIYFDPPTKRRLLERLAGVLAPGGYLLIGHSETLPAAEPGFIRAGRTIYRRSGPDTAASPLPHPKEALP